MKTKPKLRPVAYGVEVFGDNRIYVKHDEYLHLVELIGVQDVSLVCLDGTVDIDVPDEERTIDVLQGERMLASLLSAQPCWLWMRMRPDVDLE